MTIEYGFRELPAAASEQLTNEALRMQHLFAGGDPQAALELADWLWDQIPGDTVEAKVVTAVVPQLVSGAAMLGAAGAGLRGPALLWLERYRASYGYQEEPVSLVRQGEALYLLEETAQATAVFARVLRLYGQEPFRGVDPVFLRLAQGKPAVDPALTQALGDELDRLAREGTEALGRGDWEQAVAVWLQAWALVPEPKDSYPATMWFCGSVADAYWAAGRFDHVIQYARRALEASDRTNGFLWLRLGQAQYEMGQSANALNSLASAFMLEGQDLFEAEDPKYLDFLRAEGVAD